MTTIDSASPRRGPARRPRFKRHEPPPLRLTDDDIAIFRHVAKHRFLRSTHLIRLMDRPAKKLVERLGALYHNQYLDRPRAQLDYYATAGSAPIVYALGNLGAQVLSEIDGASAPKVDWTDKNRTARRPFIEHSLLVADAMVAYELATRARPDLLLMEPNDILARAPEATRRARNPWTWRAKVPHAGTMRDAAIIPDKVFGLDFTSERKRYHYFLEADRASMPVVRTPKSARTSYNGKLAAYYFGHRAREHTHRFGIGNFRVLTLTTSPERIATMLAALKEITGGAGSNLFLFTDRATLAAAPDVLTLEWINGKGERVRLA